MLHVYNKNVILSLVFICWLTRKEENDVRSEVSLIYTLREILQYFDFLLLSRKLYSHHFRTALLYDAYE